MKVSKKTMIITSIVTVLPIFFGLLMWDKLPDPMPTHFGADGQVDGWSSKGFAVIVLPLFMLFAHFLCVGASLVDPKRKNYSDKLFGLIVWLCPVLSIFMEAFTYAYALGYEVNTTKYAMILVSMVMIIIGNYLPKCKQNYTLGIKLPWTLADEANWNVTHRISGYLYMGCGLAMLVNSFFFCWPVFAAIIIIMVLVPAGYSYLYYRKHGVKEE